MERRAGENLLSCRKSTEVKQISGPIAQDLKNRLGLWERFSLLETPGAAQHGEQMLNHSDKGFGYANRSDAALEVIWL